MNKKIIYLVVILIDLVAALFISERLGKKTPTEKELKFFPELTEQGIGSINIRDKNTTTIKIRRKGDVWVVSKSTDTDEKEEEAAAGQPPLVSDAAKTDSISEKTETAQEQKTKPIEYSVDSASISAALEKITALKKDALISSNPEKQKIFEVDSANGNFIEVTDLSGKLAGSFIIGKSGPDYNSNYIRTIGSNDVFIARGGIRNALFSDLKRWRDKSILKFDKSTAKGITLAKKDSAMITLAQSDTGNPWKIIEPINSPAKTEEVDGILNKLSTLNASDFQDEVLEDSAMGFDNPELGVTVSFKNGSSRNILFGKKNEDKKYWIKTDGKEQIFLIGEYYFNQINSKLEDLKGEPLVKSIDTDSLPK